MNFKSTLIAAALLSSASAWAEPFDGAYTGVQIGVDRHDTIKYGFDYGAFIGYNKKLNDAVVLGIEGNLDFSTAKRTETATVGTQIVSGTAKVGRSYGIAARAGYLAGPNTLFYVKGGYENIRLKLNTTGNMPGFAGLSKIAGNVDTYVIGGGIEQAVSDNTTLRIGYDYANGKGGYDRHRVQAGVAFHF